MALVGSSLTSFEDAVRNAVEMASESLRDLRIAEVTKLDIRLDDMGKMAEFRAKVNLSMKYEKDGMD
ncbi:MAG: dodecin family protein [Methanotrichaceae archaeon]|nr:dodecin family protein [Methanotrichaceae archaeon]